MIPFHNICSMHLYAQHWYKRRTFYQIAIQIFVRAMLELILYFSNISYHCLIFSSNAFDYVDEKIWYFCIKIEILLSYGEQIENCRQSSHYRYQSTWERNTLMLEILTDLFILVENYESWFEMPLLNHGSFPSEIV